MIHHRCHDLLDVIGKHKTSAPDRGHRLGTTKQCDRRARTCAQSQIVMLAGFGDDLQKVFANARVIVDLPNHGLGLDDLLGRGYRLETFQRMGVLQHL